MCVHVCAFYLACENCKQVVSAYRNQLKHVQTMCMSQPYNETSKEVCEKEVLLVEVEYQPTGTGEVKHFTTHFDIPDEKLYLCETVQSCLHLFGLKYGENDCYYHGKRAPSRADVENYNNNENIVHDDNAGSEIYLLPEHTHDLWPLVYFFISLLVFCVPCCCVLGTIIALAAPFDMDVDIDTFNMLKAKVSNILPLRHSDTVNYKLK